MSKKPQCCARLDARLRSAKSELARLARLEAYHAQAGHDVSKFPGLILSSKESIQTAKTQIAEHEAEHCTDAPCETAAHYELRA